MKTKLLEIRDEGTFFPVLAIQLDSENEPERYLLARAGFGLERADHNRYIAVWKIDGGDGQATSDIYAWQGGYRTMRIAHDYINKSWPTIRSGDVIDVEYINGESQTKKISERLTSA